MKFPIKILTCFFLTLMILSCKQQQGVKIGLLFHALDKDRWESDRDYFVEKAEELGATVLFMEANNDPDVQFNMAQRMLSEGVNALVVVPIDQFAAARIAEEAKSRNVPVISYDRLIMNAKLDYYVSTDNVEIGELQARYLTTIKPEGNYALIGGARKDHNSQFLHLGHMNVFAPLIERGDVNIVLNTFTEAWEEHEGYDITREYLRRRNAPIDAIIAGNDAIALGAIRALEEAQLAGQVLVAGMDADLQNLQEIVKGTQTCTVYKPIAKMASTAAEIAFRLGSGLECERTFLTTSNGEMLVPSYLFNGVIVNKQNLRLTVVSEGFQSEDDIFR